MKWLQANPVGMVLAGIGGFLVLIALIMAVWSTLPVSVDVDEGAVSDLAGTDRVAVADSLESLAEYEVINQKPVFNESRLPVIEDEELLDEDDAIDPEIAVAGAPDVKLTGIIIAPGMKLASLTPNDASIESVMAYEGDALTGQFLGWHISRVDPRNVELKSLDGQTLKLELEVHDAKIQEPVRAAPAPKEVAVTAAEPNAEQGQPPVEGADGDDEPLSRAEQIRQRIAERREELRREQEAAQEKMNQRAARASRPPDTNAYQNAIRARINSQRKDKSSDDKEQR